MQKGERRKGGTTPHPANKNFILIRRRKKNPLIKVGPNWFLVEGGGHHLGGGSEGQEGKLLMAVQRPEVIVKA